MGGHGLSRDRVYEIEELGGELDDDEYASYELDDEPQFIGESIADAIHALCNARVEPLTRTRAARGTAAPAIHARGLRIATHCTSVAQFVGRFHPFCSERSIFVPSAKGDVGTEVLFSFDLEDGTTAFRGLGTITDHAERGISIAIRKLDPNSRSVFAELLSARRVDRADRVKAAVLKGPQKVPVRAGPLRARRRTSPTPTLERRVNDAS